MQRGRKVPVQVVFQDENCSSSCPSDTNIPCNNRSSAFVTAPKRALGDITNVAKSEKSNVGKKVSFKVGQQEKGDYTAVEKQAAESSKSSGSSQNKNTTQTCSQFSQFVSKLDQDFLKKSSRVAKKILEQSKDNLKVTIDSFADLALHDIDSSDRHDPQQVVAYVNRIIANHRRIERKFMPDPQYMMEQPDINERMRAILIDWLVDVHLKFKLLPETLYLTVNLIDRFLSLQHITRQKLQLVGVTAMLIASKYEEIYPPEVRDFEYITDKAYNKEEILSMEAIMLNILKFDLTIASSLNFLTRFLKAADADKQSMLFANYLLELCLSHYKMIRYEPSRMAASAVYLTGKLVGRFEWSDKTRTHSNYAATDLKTCSEEMLSILHSQNDPNLHLTAVKRKYSLQKFGEVSKISVDCLETL
ncbi:Cyclin-B2-4 [Galdieria sulphuraria]|uniref:G2/mitotic-specific cyclin 1/2 n=1 Tax=Galdieria sulphuraria TaxID=130081 RepID=M2Y2Z1_GALSU|nr:G2/mitotic-specific cyclin 1/2 [Galdieria sulphuraria]EME30308.1 G2/mitotic-specific cyclin 1/2 [Galdieria sulphuraria]GJD08472.1 Cyclin-B2-4 [Galdieria sulphuraria]|eukprot:XP_005706828.1 G2/mitotic-specific cyclin 1/2 [Galdieria sulphuraria]